MSETPRQEVRSQPDSSGSPLEDPYNVAMDTVPSEWIEAQIDSPTGAGDAKALPRARRINTIPTGMGNPYVANIAAVGTGFVGGAVWYALAELNLYSGPWVAPLIGAVIGLLVLLAGGTDRIYRSVLCLGVYCTVLLIVLMLLTRSQLIEIYGAAGGFENYEQALLRTRLQNSTNVTAYALGALASILLSFPDRPSR